MIDKAAKFNHIVKNYYNKRRLRKSSDSFLFTDLGFLLGNIVGLLKRYVNERRDNDLCDVQDCHLISLTKGEIIWFNGRSNSDGC